jgi:hypothetical protein
MVEETLHLSFHAETHVSPADRQEQASQRRSRVTVYINSNKSARISSYKTQKRGYVKYVCWTIHITILMRITSAATPTLPLDVKCMKSVTVDPKPSNPLAEIIRTTDTIRIMRNLRRGTFHGDGYTRIEFSWAHIVLGSLPSPQAMGPSDPPFLHAHDTVLALQRNPAGSTGAPTPRMARPPKLSRSIEPA